MVKTPISCVLASLRPRRTEKTGGKVPIRSHVIEASGQAKLGMYLLGLSLAAALLAEQPVSAGWGWVGENSPF